MLTDTFVLPDGVFAQLGSLVIGLDQHLYAYDWIAQNVWQWRVADANSTYRDYQHTSMGRAYTLVRRTPSLVMKEYRTCASVLICPSSMHRAATAGARAM